MIEDLFAKCQRCNGSWPSEMLFERENGLWLCGRCGVQALDESQQEVAKLKHVIDVAERLDTGEVIHEEQPHHRLWQIVAGNRASMRALADACEETRKTKEALVNAHFAIDRWANASQVVGAHRSCSCAVCEALYDFQAKLKEGPACS